MSYKSYRAGVERARAGLQAELTQANLLRHEARLPTRDIESELDARHPLLPEEAWTVQQQDRRAFAHFRRGQLAGKVILTLPTGADWQEQRALVLRRAFLEHRTGQVWLARAETGTAKAAPRKA